MFLFLKRRSMEVETPPADSESAASQLVSVEVSSTLAAAVSTAAAADQVSLVLLPSVLAPIPPAARGSFRQGSGAASSTVRQEIMTIVGFASVKGAPGATTLACLVGAAWPEQHKVMVVEADPYGGDLAARFQLSSRDGWPSFNAAGRRGRTDMPIEAHLQQLPGGLDVLVGTSGIERLRGLLTR